jgi:hypothetical protein
MYYFILNVKLDLYVIIQYITNYIYDVFLWYIRLHTFDIKKARVEE